MPGLRFLGRDIELTRGVNLGSGFGQVEMTNIALIFVVFYILDLLAFQMLFY